MGKKVSIISILLLLGCLSILQAQSNYLTDGSGGIKSNLDIPYLQKKGETVQLMVDGHPYLILGGELHNSSASSLEYMKPIWERLAKANINTVLAPVSWELIEPKEGEFDFHLVDGMIEAARRHNLHLVFLWFGSWKNGASTYVPGWVKKDQERFPLVTNKEGESLDILTPLGENTLQADAHAFARLMQHIKEVDGKKQTVIMMQVENEVGVFGDSRDWSQIADKSFKSNVPIRLTQYLQKNKNELRPPIYKLWKKNGFKTKGSWSEIFGKSVATNELFMAWHFSHFMNQMVKAGKEKYALPMYVNAWIVQPDDKEPGDYPAGGPQAHVHDIWMAGAPDIDFYVPDIYLPNFAEITQHYKEPKKAFFIPESFAGFEGASNAFYAIGACHALGYAPFGIDGIEALETNDITQAFKVLQQLSSFILKAQQEGTIAAVALNKKHPKANIPLGDYILHVKRKHGWDTTQVTDRGYALMIALSSDTYLIAGDNFQIDFSPQEGNNEVGFIYIEEGTIKEGKWHAGRRLNGDEISSFTGNVVKVKNGSVIRKVKVYQYE